MLSAILTLQNVRRAVLACAASLLAFGQTKSPLETCLDRISDEAAVFTRLAPQVIGREVMRQQAMVPASRTEKHQPRDPGARATRTATHELVAEYGFVSLKAEPGNYHELRQLISVDGQSVATPAKARKTLLSGLTSLDDKRKRQLMEELVKHGLAEVAIDFGQSLMLFDHQHLADFQFQVAGQQEVGGAEAVVIDFQQRRGHQRMTVFGEGKPQSHPLTGRIWASKADCTPVRIRIAAARTDKNWVISDEGTVDYASSPYGGLLPRSVAHRKLVNGKMITETVSEYTNFQKFSAETQIDFQPPQ